MSDESFGRDFAIDSIESEQDGFVALESIFLEEEGDEEPVEFQKDVVGFAVFEHIVGELHLDLTVYAMRSGESPYRKNVCFKYHSVNIAENNINIALSRV